MDADVVDSQDVRMIQPPGGACLLFETTDAARVRGERLRDQFDRDLAIETRVPRLVDLAHAAGADGRDDLEPVNNPDAAG